jgi:diguanylate cyclase (GGDEF)-like protein
LRSLRVSAYFVAVICALVLVTGTLLAPGSGPMPVLIAVGLLAASFVAGLLLMLRNREVDRLAIVWLSLAVATGVQLLGGAWSPVFPVYFLLLTWMALPPVSGPATETGWAIGVVEALSLLTSRSGILHGGFDAEVLIGTLLPALSAFLAPALYGIAVEWIAEKSSAAAAPAVIPESRTASPTVPEVTGFPMETARSLLPLLHRRSGAWASCLFTVHDEGSFLLADYLGGGGRITDRSLVSSDYWLLQKIADSWDILETDLGSGSGSENMHLPWYPDPPGVRHVLSLPAREEEDLRLFFLLESRDERFPPEVIEDLRDTVGVVTAAAGDSCRDPLAAVPGGSWFSSLLVQTSDATELRQIFHVVVRHLHRLVEGATVTVAVLDEDGKQIQVYESQGRFSRRRSGRKFPLDAGVAGWVIRYRKLMRRNRMRLGDKAVRTLSESDDPDREVGSCCAVPLTANGKTMGVLLLEREEDDGFGRDHEHLLQGVAGLLSLALERLLLDITGRDAGSLDSLTGLQMITDFHEALLDTVKDVRRYGRSIAVLEVDLDDFGGFNLQHGYRLGDRVLNACARRLEDLLGAEASIARVGGDSFGICLPGADRIAAEAVAEKVAASFTDEPLEIDGDPFPVTVSIGGCCSHTDRKIAQLPLEASRALEQVRQNGRSRCRVVELGAFSLE